MNALEQYIKSRGLDPLETMNLLSDAGVISDNAVTPADVAEPDCARAVDYLIANKLKEFTDRYLGTKHHDYKY